MTDAKKRPFNCKVIEGDEKGFIVDVWNEINKYKKYPGVITIWNDNNTYIVESQTLCGDCKQPMSYTLDFNALKPRKLETCIFKYDWFNDQSKIEPAVDFLANCVILGYTFDVYIVTDDQIFNFSESMKGIVKDQTKPKQQIKTKLQSDMELLKTTPCLKYYYEAQTKVLAEPIKMNNKWEDDQGLMYDIQYKIWEISVLNPYLKAQRLKRAQSEDAVPKPR